jgi:hypothetical protein
MASSSKARSSSRKRRGTGKARVISTKRKDALPRTGSVSAARRKQVVLPPIETLAEPPSKAVAARKKKAHTLHQKGSTASRKKAPRAAGRASATLDKLDAMEIAQALAALEPVADAVAVIEPPATAYEELTVTAAEATEVEALTVAETELAAEASAIVEELSIEEVIALRIAVGPPPIREETRAPPPAHTTAESPPPAAPAPQHDRRASRPAISRLLSTLSRWAGVSGTK